jgi:hypothetical protein
MRESFVTISFVVEVAEASWSHPRNPAISGAICTVLSTVRFSLISR